MKFKSWLEQNDSLSLYRDKALLLPEVEIGVDLVLSNPKYINAAEFKQKREWLVNYVLADLIKTNHPGFADKEWRQKRIRAITHRVLYRSLNKIPLPEPGHQQWSNTI